MYFPRQASCSMRPNPAYPTTGPYGFFRLGDFSAITDSTSPVWIWGNTFGLPTDVWFHAFTVNENLLDCGDCATSCSHLSNAGETHGFINWNGTNNVFGINAHKGDLLPVVDGYTGTCPDY